MTNGDRIRELASTNEGLAELIRKYVGCAVCPAKCENSYGECEKSLKEWIDKDFVKPCPFCGDEKPMKIWTSTTRMHCVSCRVCDARTGDYSTQEAAMNAWNRRIENAD